jgi:predicted Zn-dependent peptidase
MRTFLLLAAAGATLALIVPAAVAASAQKLDRDQRPTPGPAPAIVTPKIQRATLKNGLPVWLVERHELPIVSAILQFQAGAAQDGATPGISAMTAALLDEGTAKRSALEFNEAVGFLGATLTASSGMEVSAVSLQTLAKHAGAALDLMGEMVAQPAFSAEELERERKSRLQGLQQQKDVAASTADRVFALVTYGAEHPYGHPASGTLESVGAMTRDQITGFYQRFYRPNNGVLIVVGDVTLATLVPKLEHAFAGWTSAAEPLAVGVPSRPAAKPTAVYLVDKPNAAQSEIRIGLPGTARTASPDYYALQVLNTALGGQFSSRVNLNLRERHGFTYGARSSWAFRRGDGPFVAGAGVFTAKTDSSLTEFLREIKDIRGPRPLTAKEAEFAR